MLVLARIATWLQISNILPRKYNCSLFDRFCTILADISLIMTSDYFGLILIDRDRSKSFIGQYQKQSKPAKLNTFILNDF